MSLFGINRYSAEKAAENIYELKANLFAKEIYIDYLEAKGLFKECFNSLVELREKIEFLYDNELYEEIEIERNKWFLNDISSSIYLVERNIDSYECKIDAFYQEQVDENEFKFCDLSKDKLENYISFMRIHAIPKKFMNEFFIESFEYKLIKKHPINISMLNDVKCQIDNLFALK